MDQCDSLITKLITELLDWYSGDMYVLCYCVEAAKGREVNCVLGPAP